MTLGFTGTREGMTAKQFEVVARLVKDLDPDLVLFGDCIGADLDFFNIVENIRGSFGKKPVTRALPPKNEKLRAHCNADIIDPPEEYLTRNKSIANICTKLIACPKESTEQLRSGTWSTVRYARLAKKVIYIVIPNGEIR